MLSESAARHAMARSRVQAFKIAEQQPSEIAPRRQTRPPDAVGVELRALCLDEGVEAGVVQDAIQPRVEWMPGTFRQIRRGDPHTCLSVTLPLLTHRHTWSIRTETVLANDLIGHLI